METLEDIKTHWQPPRTERDASEIGHQDDAYEIGEHRQRLVRERVRDQGRQTEHRLASDQPQAGTAYVAEEGAVRIGRRHVEDAEELREDDNKHKVCAQHEEAVDRVNGNGQHRSQRPFHDDTAAQNPKEFPLRCLKNIKTILLSRCRRD